MLYTLTLYTDALYTCTICLHYTDATFTYVYFIQALLQLTHTPIYCAQRFPVCSEQCAVAAQLLQDWHDLHKLAWSCSSTQILQRFRVPPGQTPPPAAETLPAPTPPCCPFQIGQSFKFSNSANNPRFLKGRTASRCCFCAATLLYCKSVLASAKFFPYIKTTFNSLHKYLFLQSLSLSQSTKSSNKTNKHAQDLFFEKL